MKPSQVVTLATALALSAPACERRDADEATRVEAIDTTKPVTHFVTTGKTSASEAIAQARCDREQRCGNIAPGKDYGSRDACVAAIRSEWKDELNVFECPGGIETSELEECLEEVRNEDCQNPFDTLGRIVACRSGDICKAMAP